MTIFATVKGNPVPQGSLRAIVRGSHAFVVHTNANELAAWRNAVAHVLQSKMTGALLEGPVYAYLLFRLPRPKSRRKDDWVDTRPDIDKLTRAVLDAMTGVVFHDDSQVALVTTYKRFETEKAPPGVLIRVGSLVSPLRNAVP